MEALLNGLKVIGIILEVILIFNLIIFVHELGHFLAAKWRGLKIEKFQVWFGKPIWKREINGVQYGLGTIPAGGFVSLPQMAPMEVMEGSSSDEPMPKISPLDKIIVAFAGPLFSIGLAFVFACLVWWVGKPTSAMSLTTEIGWVSSDADASAQQLQPGDVVKEVDGRPVNKFHGMVDSITWNVISSENETIPFTVLRDGEEMTFEVKPYSSSLLNDEKVDPDEKKPWLTSLFERPPLRTVGLAPAYVPVVGNVIDHGPAKAAGLQKGDILLTVNGEKVFHNMPLNDYIRTNGLSPVQLTVERDGEPLTLTITPKEPDNPNYLQGREADDVNPMIGVAFEPFKKDGVMRPGPNPFLQIESGLKTMKNTLVAVFSPKSDVSFGHMSGPVGIGGFYYDLFGSPNGWRLAIWFSVILNINLAILNMLPFPVLDGGHITLALLEAIRKRPMNARFLEVVQTACALTLIGFMLFVTLKDIGDRLPGSGPKIDPKAMPFSPPKTG